MKAAFLIFSIMIIGARAENLNPYLTFTEKWEGRESSVYTCTAGFKTIGVGHRIKQNEHFTTLTDKEIDTLYSNDMKNALKDARTIFKNFDTLPHQVRLIVTDLSYNLGVIKLSKFVKTIDACNNHDFKKMALELKDSLWYKQTGNRAKNHVRTLEGL